MALHAAAAPTAPRSWASRSSRRQADWRAAASPRPGLGDRVDIRAAGLPRRAGRALRRHLLASACSSTSARRAWPSTSPTSHRLLARVAGCSTTASARPARQSAASAARLVHRPLRVPRWRAARRRQRRAGACRARGFEVRDARVAPRALRPDPAPLGGATSRRHWDEAVALVGARRARVWRLYMAGLGRQLRERPSSPSTRSSPYARAPAAPQTCRSRATRSSPDGAGGAPPAQACRRPPKARRHHPFRPLSILSLPFVIGSSGPVVDRASE